ncbi:hypothetical protein CLOP_g12901 [Closterium sp. NIES-67]|nr:hypothetical protein CLOP_g12901 [Closterium sp. NIES-67]
MALKSACTEIGPAQLVKHRTSRGVRTAPQRPLKSRRSEYCSRTVVLITASGLQGEQPLVNGLMWVREVGKTDP